MPSKQSMIPLERVERSIIFIRGKRVMLDADLAVLYGVPTRTLNQAVKRNKARFPVDFMFKLSKKEKGQVVTNCDHLQRLKFSPALPHAFTEHGAIMLANVLKSKRAIEVSIHIVRAFVRLREMLASHMILSQKLNALEKKYDKRFKLVFEVIRQLMKSTESKGEPIGFRVDKKRIKNK